MRTHDERFAGLPGFAFAPHYLEWRGLRAHYLDEGQGERTYLCLHGNPTWSYLYRRMIPPFVASGCSRRRARSHRLRPLRQAGRRGALHVRFPPQLSARVHRSRNLKNITLVVQDWGGAARPDAADGDARALRAAAAHEHRARHRRRPLSTGFIAWRSYSQKNPDLAVGKLLARACPHLTDGGGGGLRRAVPRRALQGGRAALPADGSGALRRPRRGDLQKGEDFLHGRVERRELHGHRRDGPGARAGRDAAAARLDPRLP